MLFFQPYIGIHLTKPQDSDTGLTQWTPNRPCLRIQMPRIRSVPFCTPHPGYLYQYVTLIVHFEDEDVTPCMDSYLVLVCMVRPGYEPKLRRNSNPLVNGTAQYEYRMLFSAASRGQRRSRASLDKSIYYRIFCEEPAINLKDYFCWLESHVNMPSVPLENFTFDMFFEMFLQIWPREEVVDLFSTYSDGFGQMDHNGLNEFLNRSISKSMQIRPCLESDISTNRLDCPRKIKHINLMQWEARHFYRNQKKDDIARQNIQAPSRTNEGHRSRSEHHHSVARSTRTATTRRAGLMSQSKTSRDQSIGTNQIHVTFQLGVDEFRELVNRYEWNLASRKKNRLSVQGFYRFLLSHHYQTLMRYHTVQDTGPTVGDDKSGLCMMEPITHYHIQSACLISPPIHIFDSKSDTTESVARIQRRNVLTATRTIRQLLLLGTRALVLDCWFMNQPITQEIDKDVNWFVEPMCSSGQLSSSEWNTNNDLSQEISPMDRLTHSVPLKDVLKAIRSSVFLVSHYPLLLFLRIDTMGSREQNLLAGLLQDSLGQWLLIPPLPKFVAQPNSPYLEKSKYYSQAHPADEGGAIQARSCRLPPLTVLVTDPEGEEKVAKPDIGSLSSSTQLSPVTSRRLSITSGKSTRLFHPRTHQFLNSDYKPALHGHRTEFMGTLMCPHPRLARLIALTEPDLLPPLCHMLFTQHHRTTLTGKCRPNPVSDAAKQTPNNSYGDERSEVALGKNDPPSVMVDDFEVILSLSSLTFARTVQLQHRARKRRLLKRLLTEAYGHRTRRGVQRKIPDADSKIRDSEPDILNKKQGPEGPSKEGNFTTAGRGSIRMRGIRGWFGKRVVPPVSSSAEANTSNRPSLLSSGSENSRRTSVIATPFRTRSPIPEKTDHVGADASVAGQTRNLFTSFYRRLSILSNGLPSPKTPREFLPSKRVGE
ncbi:hypothetical protein FGIG_07891 [Fasciola gigantica]|uniref:phosphoinositide phospholipase C n=1 Tax=Fasciola gigantica TaxID=46835 RepID=A0A504YVS2_FASGI|nr:hypothetical protein FGIG_07891 [Fasciola gigantica]